MKIPYGESNFKKVITEGFVYFDKTPYIPKLEAAGSHLFLLRPRRFGKSLFLSMLEYYYDVAHQQEFATLFGNLYIGQNPTPLHNSYQVLFMDFSGIDTDAGHDAILQRICDKLDNYLSSFLRRYGYPLAMQTEITTKTSPAAKMERFIELLGDQKFLLLIDEYDHFANSILAADMKLFLRIQSGSHPPAATASRTLPHRLGATAGGCHPLVQRLLLQPQSHRNGLQRQHGAVFCGQF